ncbi:4'-phosphopantetheinyl transferase family protein [Flavobacterium aquicola]|uniref:4'-phosphopantetheinyl transferase n=1 Tax=Flavobacterium aquicola TaxID=1682742 RepID=A0A3E0E1J7_9FLAO|nr:4'-phosphopantetheinyl transferase superfamily protein [Flavobacterium aquicola]REG91603.1 4'-phosphopantetheinyl transferase [Flavobacterium aquicola]
MIYIYYAFISENNHEKLMQEFLLRFPIDFQNKIKSYQRWEDAQLSLLGRILLYRGTDNFNGTYKETSVKYTKYKKPYFGEDKVCFNISHSGEIVVCAVTNVCDIGIDIELQRDIQIQDFQSEMTEGEWIKISTSFNKKGSFYNYWTQKEAVIKGGGKGLSVPLKSFEISKNIAIVENKKFFLKEIKLDSKYKCHIATSKLVNEKYIKILELDSLNNYINLI